MRDLERVRYVTGNFSALQGLRRTVIGLLGLVNFANVAGWTDGWELVSLLAVCALALLYWQADVYYKRYFGNVEPLKAKTGRRMYFIAAAAALVILGSVGVDTFLKPPVGASGLGFAAVMLVVLWPRRRFEAHNILLAVLLAVASILPATGLVPTGHSGPDHWGLTPYASSMMAAAVMIVLSGILDHLLLVRALKPIPSETGDEAV